LEVKVQARVVGGAFTKTYCCFSTVVVPLAFVAVKVTL
jgi:hypothetical protein